MTYDANGCAMPTIGVRYLQHSSQRNIEGRLSNRLFPCSTLCTLSSTYKNSAALWKNPSQRNIEIRHLNRFCSLVRYCARPAKLSRTPLHCYKPVLRRGEKPSPLTRAGVERRRDTVLAPHSPAGVFESEE